VRMKSNVIDSNLRSFIMLLCVFFAFSSYYELASGLVIPLIVKNGGCPYTSESFLIDSGASTSVSRPMLRPSSSIFSTHIASTSNSAEVSLPPGVDGIVGFDFMMTRESLVFDFNDNKLYIDEAAPFEASPPKSQVQLKFKTVVGGALLPTIPFTAYGVSQSTSEGIVDTGSPLTIVSPTFAQEAALFDCDGDLDVQHGLSSIGVDGLSVSLDPKKCAGLTCGDAVDDKQISLPQFPVYVGDIAMMQQTCTTVLIGLDTLGPRFKLDIANCQLSAW